MKRRTLCNIVLLLLCACAYAQSDIVVTDSVMTDSAAFVVPKGDMMIPEKTPIYQGTQVKLDLASPILVPATTNWVRQNYEIAVNVRLKDRFYPTFEAGYATPGGFIRIGTDINPLKKHPESPHALLIGVRVGTAVQAKGYTDCWGEIVAGCQVEIAKVQHMAFYMGWMGRLKLLFTREYKENNPSYIPGFGNRDKAGWGVNYYLGWKF